MKKKTKVNLLTCHSCSTAAFTGIITHISKQIPLEIRASLDFTCIFNPIFGKRRIFDIVQNYIILSVERMLVSSLIISK